MAVASPSSGKLDVVSADSRLGHCRKGFFLKDSFLRAVVDGCHRRLCIPKRAASRQPVTEWASHLNQMKLNKVTDFGLHADRELIRLRSSVSMLSELVPREARAQTIIKSLVQYRKTFDVSYHVCFQEARVAEIARAPASGRLIQGAVESS